MCVYIYKSTGRASNYLLSILLCYPFLVSIESVSSEELTDV